MCYCPEDGTKMKKVSEFGLSICTYHCPECNTDWQNNTEDGCYSVVAGEEVDEQRCWVVDYPGRLGKTRAEELG